MCTVTLTALHSSEKSFVLTSSRDEVPHRETISPQFYEENGVRMLYPKDKVGGGSWIGVSELQRLVCLLNGGFESHTRRDSYRMSRGVVVKDFLATKEFEETLENYDLKNIEPFTLIAADWNSELEFYELVWDGITRHIKPLSKAAHIWSSSPLYDSEMKSLRNNWFRDFRDKKDMNAQSLWDFHHNAGVGDKTIDVFMDRGFIKTQSITQVIRTQEKTRMIYENLNSGEITAREFETRPAF